MELKSKSVSEMDNKELRQINERLQNENRAIDLILSIKRINGVEWDYNNPPKISTKTPIGQILKTSTEFEDKTISDLDDAELTRFIYRLDSEERTLNLLYQLKSKTDGLNNYPDPPTPIQSDVPIEEIYHYRTKGSKNGERLYQYTDGSWTPAGRVRYGKGGPNLGTGKLSDIVKRQKLESEYEKLNPTAEQKRAKELEKINKESDNILKEALKIGTSPKTKMVTKDYANLTNEELKSRIERLNLESNYGRLTGDTKMVRSGGDWAREIIQTTGAIMAIGVSAATLYDVIKKFKKVAPAVTHSDFLEHHGIKGQRWGIRRYQNDDGTLTEAGQRRLENADDDDARAEAQKKKTKKAIIIGVAATAAAVVGTAWYLKRKQAMQQTIFDANDKLLKDNIEQGFKNIKDLSSAPIKPEKKMWTNPFTGERNVSQKKSRKLHDKYDEKFGRVFLNEKTGKVELRKPSEIRKMFKADSKAAKNGSSWLSKNLSIPANIKNAPGSTPAPAKSFVNNLLKEHKWLI